MQNHRFRVAVVGEFNRGKSTFLNALLGQQILPADILPSTATINRIVYGSEPRSFLMYKDGTSEEVNVSDLSDYITKRTSESEEYASKVSEAVVEFPSIFCQNHVDLIDTPGMNDDDKMEGVTLSQLGNVDLAIMVVSAFMPFSESEAWLMRRLLETEGICQIIVVVTGIDRLFDEDDRAKILTLLHTRIPEMVRKQLESSGYGGDDPIWDKYERIIPNLNIFGVSSTDALRGIEKNDNALYQGSGFPELTRKLPSLILTSQNASTILRPLTLVRRVINEYKTGVPAFRTYTEALHQKMRDERIEFANRVYAFADTIADPLEERLFSLVDGYMKLQDAACKDYIKALSTVKTLDSGLIGKTLNDKTAELLESYNQIRTESLEPQLAEMANTGWQESCQDVISAIYGMVSGVTFLNEKSKSELHEILDSYLGGIFRISAPKEFAFTWSHSPVATYAFMDEALIEYVHKGVRESFRDFEWRKRDAIISSIHEAVTDFSDILENIVVAAFRLSNEQIAADKAQLERLEEDDIAQNLDRLENDTRALEKEFYQSLGETSAAENTEEDMK